jgi:hypothetical protein
MENDTEMPMTFCCKTCAREGLPEEFGGMTVRGLQRYKNCTSCRRVQDAKEIKEKATESWRARNPEHWKAIQTKKRIRNAVCALKNKATRARVPWDLTIDEGVRLAGPPCARCGGVNALHLADPEAGYISGNVYSRCPNCS